MAACNGGNSTAGNANNSPQTNQLQKYLNPLTYTPKIGKHLAGRELVNQQSFYKNQAINPDQQAITETQTLLNPQ